MSSQDEPVESIPQENRTVLAEMDWENRLKEARALRAAVMQAKAAKAEAGIDASPEDDHAPQPDPSAATDRPADDDPKLVWSDRLERARQQREAALRARGKTARDPVRPPSEGAEITAVGFGLSSATGPAIRHSDPRPDPAPAKDAPAPLESAPAAAAEPAPSPARKRPVQIALAFGAGLGVGAAIMAFQAWQPALAPQPQTPIAIASVPQLPENPFSGVSALPLLAAPSDAAARPQVSFTAAPGAGVLPLVEVRASVATIPEVTELVTGRPFNASVPESGVGIARPGQDAAVVRMATVPRLGPAAGAAPLTPDARATAPTLAVSLALMPDGVTGGPVGGPAPAQPAPTGQAAAPQIAGLAADTGPASSDTRPTAPTLAASLTSMPDGVTGGPVGRPAPAQPAPTGQAAAPQIAGLAADTGPASSDTRPAGPAHARSLAQLPGRAPVGLGPELTSVLPAPIDQTAAQQLADAVPDAAPAWVQQDVPELSQADRLRATVLSRLRRGD